jgi:hypothetical protein
LFTTFFSDVLIFTNSVGFLYMFKHMAESKGGKNNSGVKSKRAVNREAKKGSKIKKEDMMDSMNKIMMLSPSNKQNESLINSKNLTEGTVNTAAVNKILSNANHSSKGKKSNQTNNTLQNDDEYEFDID